MKPQGGKGKYNIGVALEKAVHDLAQKNPGQVSMSGGINFNRETGEYLLPFLNRRYFVCHATGEVKETGGGKPVSTHLRLLMLHYLITASGKPLKNEWITFKELPGGQIYVTPYSNRALKPLVKAFGERPRDLYRAAEALGGETGNLGDFSVVLTAFPRVPVALALWEGDEEFPPRGNVFYDAHASYYLPTEDYALLPGILLGELSQQI